MYELVIWSEEKQKGWKSLLPLEGRVCRYLILCPYSHHKTPPLVCKPTRLRPCKQGENSYTHHMGKGTGQNCRPSMGLTASAADLPQTGILVAKLSLIDMKYLVDCETDVERSCWGSRFSDDEERD